MYHTYLMLVYLRNRSNSFNVEVNFYERFFMLHFYFSPILSSIIQKVICNDNNKIFEFPMKNFIYKKKYFWLLLAYWFIFTVKIATCQLIIYHRSDIIHPKTVAHFFLSHILHLIIYDSKFYVNNSRYHFICISLLHSSIWNWFVVILNANTNWSARKAQKKYLHYDICH